MSLAAFNTLPWPCPTPTPTLTAQGGDAVWEGIRVYHGCVFHLEEHLQRLHDSARAMAFQDIPSKAFIKVTITTC